MHNETGEGFLNCKLMIYNYSHNNNNSYQLRNMEEATPGPGSAHGTHLAPSDGGAQNAFEGREAGVQGGVPRHWGKCHGDMAKLQRLPLMSGHFQIHSEQNVKKNQLKAQEPPLVQLNCL